ncbi:MAG: DUF1571 domain-containing protein [Planctomycetia bacterium]|nr:DUF1571 domain-containing protein [Planctomycetia bacterium]
MKRISCLLIFAVAAIAVLFSPAFAGDPKPPISAIPSAENAEKHWQVTDVYARADEWLKRLAAIDSYTTTICSRELIDGTLGDYRHIYMKFRPQPTSFYFYFLGPPWALGREAVYVENLRDGLVNFTFISDSRACFGLRALRPDSFLATHGLRCPMHKLNLRDLTEREISFLKEHEGNGPCTVRQFAGAKINDRLCTVIQVTQDGGKEPFMLRIFADDVLQLPVRFELHLLDGKEHKPELLEEYTFLDINPDAKLTDLDFDMRNPRYGWHRLKVFPASPPDSTPPPAVAREKIAASESCNCGRRWLRRRR